jgi:hypothetical protein
VPIPPSASGAVAAALAAAQQRAAAAAAGAGASGVGARWAPLRLDALGREIDASGQVVTKSERATVSSLKINIAHEEKKKEEPLMTPAELKRLAMSSNQISAPAIDTTVSNKYFDESLVRLLLSICIRPFVLPHLQCIDRFRGAVVAGGG